jgi:hypothetical protein
MGYHGTGVNYGGRELHELREPVVYGLGPSGLSQSQQAWQEVSRELRQVGMFVESSMNKNAAAREGAAADAANVQGLSPLAAYAQAAQIQADFAAEATGNQADYYTTARNGMPEHMDRPSLWADILTPWEYFGKKREYDRRVDTATDMMNSYQANSNSNISTMPEFTKPQNANIGMAVPIGTQVNPGSTSTAAPTLPAGVGTAPASAGVMALPGGRAVAPTLSGGTTGGYGGVGTGPGYGGGMSLPGGGIVGPSGGTARPGTGGGTSAGTARPGTSGGRSGIGGEAGRPGTSAGRTGGSTSRFTPGTLGAEDEAGRAGGRGGYGPGGRAGLGAGEHAATGRGPVEHGPTGRGPVEHGPTGRGTGEHAATGRGAGPRGTGGSMFGPMGGAGGAEDIEHKTPDYLVETQDIFRDATLVAPPVIGEKRPDYYDR